jgi:cytochrome c oxidase assembly protein subunit 19
MNKSKAPDRGSFVLDHFKECVEFINEYSKCLENNANHPKKCRKFQADYLECRMKKGLMKQEKLENLGFTKDLEWETEEQEKEAIYDRIQQMKEERLKAVLKYMNEGRNK